MSSFKARLSAAAGAALLATAIALWASPAMASATNCNQPMPLSVQECTAISGSGLHINSMSGWANSYQAYVIPNVHIELEGPNGLIKNCSQHNVPIGGSTPVCTWSPNHNEKAGLYCSTAWEHPSGGGYVKIASVCVDVHS
jgi:hypothetical protein